MELGYYDDPEIGRKALREIMVNGARKREDENKRRDIEEKKKQKRDKIFQIRLALIFFLLGVLTTVIAAILTR